MVSVFFILGDDYNPNTPPEVLICLNKAGKDIGLYKYFILISRSNIHF